VHSKVLALDTNVLVRFLAADHPTQARAAKALIARAAENRETVFISTVVLCETLWVLRKAYRSDRKTLAAVVQGLLETPTFVIQDDALVRRALLRYNAGGCGFADYIIGESARAGCTAVVTFDGRLARESNYRLLQA
jgi:predicted nucleic-acid-binding protein